MKAYIIEVETRLHEKIQYHKISQEGYSSYNKAKEFILSRSDNPQESSPFIFRSEHLTYTIREITII